MADRFISEHSNINKSIFASMNSISQSILSATVENATEQPSAASSVASPTPFTYKSACIELFNRAFNAYKQHNNQDQKVRSIGREQYPDYEIFCDISTGMEILRGFIGYAIWRHRDNWDMLCKQHNITTTEQLLESPINIPQNDKGLIGMFSAYPWAIDDLHVELFHIINLDNFEFMLKLCKINKLLYFNTFPEPEDADPILECKNDVTELWVHIRALAKKLLKHHIAIAKLVEKADAYVATPNAGVSAATTNAANTTEASAATIAEASGPMDVDLQDESSEQEPPAKIRKVATE